MVLLYPLAALFAITLGPGGNTHEIYKDSLPPLSQALESGSESSKISSVREIVCNLSINSAFLPFWAIVLKRKFFFLMCNFLL